MGEIGCQYFPVESVAFPGEDVAGRVLEWEWLSGLLEHPTSPVVGSADGATVKKRWHAPEFWGCIEFPNRRGILPAWCGAWVSLTFHAQRSPEKPGPNSMISRVWPITCARPTFGDHFGRVE